jgi:hypothetical protein
VLLQQKDSRAAYRAQLKEQPKHSQLSVFQLAVLQKFDLADLLVQEGPNPISGMDHQRFLGYLIQYRKHDLTITSTFLQPIVDDPTIAAVRRFPHPADIRPCVEYLLRHEQEWWRSVPIHQLDDATFQRQTRSFLQLYNSVLIQPWWTTSGSFRFPFGQSPQHEPILSRRPGFFEVWRVALGDDRRGRAAQELKHHGT